MSAALSQTELPRSECQVFWASRKAAVLSGSERFALDKAVDERDFSA